MDKLEEKLHHALAPDRQMFDEVRIVTVPRYKTSGLSGDEWRISAMVQFIKKGTIVAERGFSNVDTAIELLSMMRVQWAEMGEGEIPGARELVNKKGLCDQEGCSEPATVKYLIKQEWCDQCGQKKESYSKQYRQFCEKHKQRGDCSLEDQDKNYELMKEENGQH